MNILIVKETRANEARVALIPKDVIKLSNKGLTIFVEHNAGIAAGYSDQAYEKAGAIMRYLKNDQNINEYKELFKGIAIIVRAKRPNRARELLENQGISFRLYYGPYLT